MRNIRAEFATRIGFAAAYEHHSISGANEPPVEPDCAEKQRHYAVFGFTVFMGAISQLSMKYQLNVSHSNNNRIWL